VGGIVNQTAKYIFFAAAAVNVSFLIWWCNIPGFWHWQGGVCLAADLVCGITFNAFCEN
jgi:hypothetical protein